MEKFKGTPGPWGYETNEYDKFSVFAKSISRGQPIVCDVSITTDYDRNDGLKQTEIRDSNANLIAAAPDLLEQLQWVVDELKDWIDSELEGTYVHAAALATLDKPNAAIARALGKNDGDE